MRGELGGMRRAERGARRGRPQPVSGCPSPCLQPRSGGQDVPECLRMSFLFHKKRSCGCSPASDVCKPEQRHQGLGAPSCLHTTLTPRFTANDLQSLGHREGANVSPVGAGAALAAPPPGRVSGARLRGGPGLPRWEPGDAGSARYRRPAVEHRLPGLHPRTGQGTGNTVLWPAESPSSFLSGNQK